ncbi:MAG: fumarate hydratase [Deltaproteobacteria bacterium]|nr:fumarate hydratase [Deltaproteobacteria bacterium]
MRNIPTPEITSKVKELCIRAACELGNDVVMALKGVRVGEESPIGQEVLDQLIENAGIALEETLPMCQDTGIAVFFVDIGRDVFMDGSLEDAINEGVRQGYRDGFLRKSVCHPVNRKNTGDNTPAIIHTRIVEGDRLKIIFAPKGAGSENMSRLAMLKPAEGLEGVKRFVLNAVREAGGNPCPPIVVGVGIGGNFEKAAILAKEALLREVSSQNPDKELAVLERELLDDINRLGIGPMGLGGRSTALAVHIKTFPCHIASLPVAVNIQCHAARHKEVVI